MSLFNESKWTDSNVETLIKLIRAHPVLWNPSCPEYKDSCAKNMAFAQIGRKFGMSTDEIRKKYRNLRSQYVREVRLRRSRGYGSKWNFFDSLMFLSAGHTCNKNESGDWDAMLPSSTKAEHHNMAYEELEQCPEDYMQGYVSFDEDYDIEANSQSKRMCLESETAEFDSDTSQERQRPRLMAIKPFQPTVRDEYAVLGEHVANEMRALRNKPTVLKSFKCSILQAILDVNRALGS